MNPRPRPGIQPQPLGREHGTLKGSRSPADAAQRLSEDAASGAGVLWIGHEEQARSQRRQDDDEARIILEDPRISAAVIETNSPSLLRAPKGTWARRRQGQSPSRW
jgi:hypothetical protein